MIFQGNLLRAANRLPLSIGVLTLSLLVAVVAPGCKQGVGDRCEITSDCQGGLECPIGGGQCKSTTGTSSVATGGASGSGGAGGGGGTSGSGGGGGGLGGGGSTGAGGSSGGGGAGGAGGVGGAAGTPGSAGAGGATAPVGGAAGGS